jgi:hypothetical protein
MSTPEGVPGAPPPDDVAHLEAVWTLLGDGLDATSPERREMFLTRVVLLLAVDGGDTEAFRRAVETAVLPG